MVKHPTIVLEFVSLNLTGDTFFLCSHTFCTQRCSTRNLFTVGNNVFESSAATYIIWLVEWFGNQIQDDLFCRMKNFQRESGLLTVNTCLVNKLFIGFCIKPLINESRLCICKLGTIYGQFHTPSGFEI